MHAAATHFYIWYTVRGDVAKLLATVAALLADVEEATGIAGRVLARRDDPSTWMEIYENVDDASRFERELAALVRRHGLAEFIEDGRRHVEQFGALADLFGADHGR